VTLTAGQRAQAGHDARSGSRGHAADAVKEAAISIDDRRERKVAKQELLLEVIAWIEENEERALDAFRQSAAQVIELLQAVEQQIRTD